jgi:hypothetical protein
MAYGNFFNTLFSSTTAPGEGHPVTTIYGGDLPPPPHATGSVCHGVTYATRSVPLIFTYFFLALLLSCAQNSGAGAPAAKPITAVSVTGLVAPTGGATPITAAALTPGNAAQYTVQSLTWETVPTSFDTGTAYQAFIVLKAKAGYKFKGDITPTVDAGTVAGVGTVSADAGENTLGFMVVFGG